jgi:hypothetical protein
MSSSGSTHPSTPSSDDGIQEGIPVVDAGTASTLLRLGLDQRRPVDRLIRRLSATDGAAWLDSALGWGPMQGMASPRDVLLGGGADLDLLKRIKERGKAIVKSAVSNDEQVAGLAGYFFAVAAALRWHGTLIANRAPGEVAEILLDVAAVAPQPYQDLLSQAAMALRSA